MSGGTYHGSFVSESETLLPVEHMSRSQRYVSVLRRRLHLCLFGIGHVDLIAENSTEK